MRFCQEISDFELKMQYVRINYLLNSKQIWGSVMLDQPLTAPNCCCHELVGSVCRGSSSLDGEFGLAG